MITVSLADAKAHLSALVERAATGEAICIARRGKPIARITVVCSPRKRIDIAELTENDSGMPVQPQAARDFIRAMRDNVRY